MLARLPLHWGGTRWEARQRWAFKLMAKCKWKQVGLDEAKKKLEDGGEWSRLTGRCTTPARGGMGGAGE